MRRRTLAASIALLALIAPAVSPSAEGFDDSDGAVLAKPLEPRARAALFAPPPAPSPTGSFEPVVRPAPAQPLPNAAPKARAPMPRVDLPAYPAVPKAPADRRGYALWKGDVTAPADSTDRFGILSPDEKLSDAVGAKLGTDAGDQLFVNIELDLKEGAELKDAVADLSRGAGFRADMRFPASRSESEKGRVSLWGWLPGAGLGPALQQPGVRRVSSSPAAHAAPGRATSEMLVGVRMSDGPGGAEAVNRARQELTSSAGVLWRKTIGYQAVPGSRDLAVIFLAGVPIRSLSRLLAHPDVLKIQAAPASPTIEDMPLPLPPEPPRAPVLERFLKYAAVDTPLLFITVILLSASAVLGLARRGGRLPRARVGAR